jgi:hypothetical protein
MKNVLLAVVLVLFPHSVFAQVFPPIRDGWRNHDRDCLSQHGAASVPMHCYVHRR